MEQKVLGLCINGHISFLQFVKYIKHKRNIGLREAREHVERILESRMFDPLIWKIELDKLEFPLAYIVTDEDRVSWLEETEEIILNFIETHAKGKDHFSSN